MDVERGGLYKYVVSFLRILKSVELPVEGCLERGKKPGRLCEHFVYCHWKYRVAIIQEGPNPLPRFDRCGMHMQADRLFDYKNMAKCDRAMKRRLRRRDVEMAVRCDEVEFSMYR